MNKSISTVDLHFTSDLQYQLEVSINLTWCIEFVRSGFSFTVKLWGRGSSLILVILVPVMYLAPSRNTWKTVHVSASPIFPENGCLLTVPVSRLKAARRIHTADTDIFPSVKQDERTVYRWAVCMEPSDTMRGCFVRGCFQVRSSLTF